MWSSFTHRTYPEGTSSQNSVLLPGLCRVCIAHCRYINEFATVVLCFVGMASRLLHCASQAEGFRAVVCDIVDTFPSFSSFSAMPRDFSSELTRQCSFFFSPFLLKTVEDVVGLLVGKDCQWPKFQLGLWPCTAASSWCQSDMFNATNQVVWWMVQDNVGAVAYSGVLFGRERGFNKFIWGQRERGSGGGSPLVRGSGGSCNLVQEISFHIVKFS